MYPQHSAQCYTAGRCYCPLIQPQIGQGFYSQPYQGASLQDSQSLQGQIQEVHMKLQRLETKIEELLALLKGK